MPADESWIGKQQIGQHDSFADFPCGPTNASLKCLYYLVGFEDIYTCLVYEKTTECLGFCLHFDFRVLFGHMIEWNRNLRANYSSYKHLELKFMIWILWLGISRRVGSPLISWCLHIQNIQICSQFEKPVYPSAVNLNLLAMFSNRNQLKFDQNENSKKEQIINYFALVLKPRSPQHQSNYFSIQLQPRISQLAIFLYILHSHQININDDDCCLVMFFAINSSSPAECFLFILISRSVRIGKKSHKN